MTIIEELAQMKAEFDVKAKALEEADATIKAGVELIAQANKERDDIKAAMSLLEAKQLEDAKVAADALKIEADAHVNTKAELEKAQKALANPAFAAAAVKGSAKAVSEGGSEAGSVMSFEQAHAEYKKIEDPKARAQFRADHAVELKLK